MSAVYTNLTNNGFKKRVVHCCLLREVVFKYYRRNQWKGSIIHTQSHVLAPPIWLYDWLERGPRQHGTATWPKRVSTERRTRLDRDPIVVNNGKVLAAISKNPIAKDLFFLHARERRKRPDRTKLYSDYDCPTVAWIIFVQESSILYPFTSFLRHETW